MFLLISIAETHRDLEPFLAWKGSLGPDCLDIAGNQAFHIYSVFRGTEKIPAYLDCLREIHLVHMPLSAFFNFHV